MMSISIHAPTRGATVPEVPRTLASYHFNPRSHERSDLNLFGAVLIFLYFNPRSHERSDKLFVAVKVWYPIFQSTLPREERQNTLSPTASEILISIHAPTRGATATATRYVNVCLYFNPRSHERSDSKAFEYCSAYRISIHAPTRGATNCIVHSTIFLIFQSTLPREERLSNS